MRALQRLSLALIALLLIAVMPSAGQCQTLPSANSTTLPTPLDGTDLPGDTSTNGAVMTNAQIAQCHKQLQQTSASVSHELMTQLDTLVQIIDVNTQYCWDQINALFNFGGTTGDPLNLLVGAVEAAVAQYVLQMVQEGCQAALSIANQLKTFALSQFNRLCIPLNNFMSGLNVNLNLHGPPCNGTQLLPIGQMFQTQPAPTYDPRSLIPLGTASTPGH